MSKKSNVKLNRLVSALDENQRNCVKTLMDTGMVSTAVITLKNMLKDETMCNDEIQTILSIIKQPNIPRNKKETPMKELTKKCKRILIKHNKLKNSSKFNVRDNMKELGKLQLEIGNEINNLHLKGLDDIEINSLTREWAMCHRKIEAVSKKIEKEDEGLMKFNLKQFVKKLDNENNRKKQLLATNKSKKKKRIIMKDKTNTNNDNNNDKTNKNVQISNNKSHLMRQQFSKMVDFEIFLNQEEDFLISRKKEMEEIAIAFGIIDENKQCHQENKWSGPFNNDITVDFVGKEAYNRYKKELKFIKTIQTKINKKKNDLNALMDETIWKKTGKTRGSKTMRDRVNDYNNKKKRIKVKNDDNKKKDNNKNKKRKQSEKEENDDESDALPPKKKKKSAI